MYRVEQNKKPFNFPHFFLYLAVALILAVPFAFVFRISTDKVALTRICNGLFFGGVIVFCLGAIAAAANLGAFALITYANKKVWQVLLRKGNDGDEKKLGSYYEYLSTRKKRKEIREMLFAGLIPIVVSVTLSIIYF